MEAELNDAQSELLQNEEEACGRVSSICCPLAGKVHYLILTLNRFVTGLCVVLGFGITIISAEGLCN
jgi:hypothetical protein